VAACRAAHSTSVMRVGSDCLVGRGFPASIVASQATVSCQAVWVTATGYGNPNIRANFTGTSISRPSVMASARV